MIRRRQGGGHSACSGHAKPDSQVCSFARSDNPSKISAAFCCEPSPSTPIFNVNQPMTSLHDKIYPGQAFRISAA